MYIKDTTMSNSQVTQYAEKFIYTSRNKTKSSGIIFISPGRGEVIKFNDQDTTGYFNAYNLGQQIFTTTYGENVINWSIIDNDGDSASPMTFDSLYNLLTIGLTGTYQIAYSFVFDWPTNPGDVKAWIDVSGYQYAVGCQKVELTSDMSPSISSSICLNLTVGDNIRLFVSYSDPGGIISSSVYPSYLQVSRIR